MQSSLTGKLMRAVCKLGEEDNKPCNLYKEKGIFTGDMSYMLVCKRLSYWQPNKEFMYPGLQCTAEHLCHMGVPNLHPQGCKQLLRASYNRDHQIFMGSLSKVSSGQIYLGITEGPAAFLLFLPDVVSGLVACSWERLGQCMLLQQSTAVSPAGNTP